MIVQFDKDTVESQYSNVLVGLSPFIVGRRTLFARHLSPLEIFESNALILGLRDKYKSEGLISEGEALRDAAQKGLWTQNDNGALWTLEKQVEAKRKVLSSLVLPSQIKQVENEIKEINKKVKEKMSQKLSLLSNCYESHIQQEKIEFLTYISIYKDTKKRLWKNLKEFEEEDRDYILEVVEASSRAMGEITSKLLRYIARTTDARQRLKTVPLDRNAPIFLLELKQWSEFYDSVFGMSDKPSDEIVANDELLDGWLMSRRARSEQSVNTGDGFVSHPGATKQDMEILGGVGREDVIRMTDKEFKK